MAEHSGPDQAAARRRLIERRDGLRRAADSAGQARAPVELDQTRIGRLSRMDALQQQAMAQATQQRRAAELGRIDAALKRIDEGEYGFCLRCGEEIAAKRLDIDPTTALCIGCARKA